VSGRGLGDGGRCRRQDCGAFQTINPASPVVDLSLTPGRYDVFLTVELRPADATTTPPVGARFSVQYEYQETGTTYCPVLATNFVDRSTGEPTHWLWRFPDGTTSTEQHPQLPNGVLGEVTLIVSNANSTDEHTHAAPIRMAPLGE
jgi:PKD repeat protein